MEILAILIPISLVMGGLGLAAFFWAMRRQQFADPQGDASRILCKDWDEHPMPLQGNQTASETVKTTK
jgi:cbb3-type cytochrome oxidase maturation protein